MFEVGGWKLDVSSPNLQLRTIKIERPRFKIRVLKTKKQ